MKRYIIDTCVLIWLIEGNKRVNDLNYDMQYYQGKFYISVEAIAELFYLITTGKVNIKLTNKTMLNDFKMLNLEVLDYDLKALDVLYDLPYFEEHPDPTDRKIIAHAIASHCTLISSDRRFPLYEPYGLKYIKV